MLSLGIVPSIQSIAAQDTLDIRHKVLWPSRTRSECTLQEDAEGLHLGAFVEERLVSVLSLYRTIDGLRVRKFATLHQWQGRGVGTALLRHAIALARDAGESSLWCDARVSASAFYAQFGLEAKGEVFQKDGVRFIRMEKQLPGMARSFGTVL